MKNQQNKNTKKSSLNRNLFFIKTEGTGFVDTLPRPLESVGGIGEVPTVATDGFP